MTSGVPGERDDARAAQKRRVAERAAELVQSGMVVGLGAGSTAAYVLRSLAERVRTGALEDLRFVPCSELVAVSALALGLRVVTLADAPEIDLTLDGADEVAPNLDLIKGRGGALLREKMVAQASRREAIVIDASKLSPRLGTRGALPVEVFAFGWRAQLSFLRGHGLEPMLRMAAGAPFVTDEGNLILDCRLPSDIDAAVLSAALDARAGIAAHGFFLGLASEVLVGDDQGVRELRRGGGEP